MLIYSISFNNKIVYIGQTIFSLEKRIKNYKRSIKDKTKKTYIINHLRAHGIENHVFNIVESVALKSDLNLKEILYIKKYNTLFPNGLNLTKGGDSAEFSLESRKKMSEAKKGKPPWNKNTVGLMGVNWAKGIKKGPMKLEVKEKIKRFGFDNHFYGKKHTEETKKLLSQKLKGRKAWNKGLGKPKKLRSKYMSNEHKTKIAKSLMGKKQTEETKKLISEKNSKPVYGYFGDELKYQFKSSFCARKQGLRLDHYLKTQKKDKNGIVWTKEKK